MLTQHEGFHYAFRVLDEVVVVDGETAGLEPHRVNLDRYLLKHEKWAGDATLEAWERGWLARYRRLSIVPELGLKWVMPTERET